MAEPDSPPLCMILLILCFLHEPEVELGRFNLWLDIILVHGGEFFHLAFYIYYADCVRA